MIRSMFRKNPEIGPNGKVTIFGPTRCRADHMAAYAARRNPKAPSVAGLYAEKAARYGIRGDLAFCQAMLDTRVWTAVLSSPPWRAFAHTIWGEWNAEWTDAELENRTELHLQFLYAFAQGRPPEEQLALPESRLQGLAQAGLLGCAPCWEDLNGKWLIPGNRYGQDIVAIWRNMMEWKGDAKNMADLGEERRETFAAWAGSRSAATTAEEYAKAGEDMAWLAARGWLPSPSPEPDGKVTWAELARLLRGWENSAK